jgi:acyl-CoA synthetase (AMP-forming)/AMP-acid ligase II
MGIKFGGTVVLEKSFIYPYHVINIILKENITGFPIVPTIAAILLKSKNIGKYDFSKLRYITSTAQVLPAQHIIQLQKIFPNTRIFSMYGLTECKRVAYLPPEDVLKKPNSVGKAMPNVEVYLVNDRGEKITNPGKIGELVVRGSNVMKGYWNLPEENAKKLKPGLYPGEKVLFTGDLFQMDNEGYLYFVARKDNKIKTSGELVSTKEVDNDLHQNDDVLEAAVIGLPDEILGQAIKAVVALKKDSKLSKEDIISFCSRKLEKFMVPKYIEFRKHLPKTTTGKIDIKALQERQQHEI